MNKSTSQKFADRPLQAGFPLLSTTGKLYQYVLEIALV